MEEISADEEGKSLVVSAAPDQRRSRPSEDKANCSIYMHTRNVCALQVNAVFNLCST